MSQTIAVLAEATRRGSISIRQLRPLGIGPEQLKTLDQFKGLNTKQLNKQLEEGKLELTRHHRLLEGNNKELGTTGVAAATQMGVALFHLANAPEQLFQEFKKTDAFKFLADKFQKLATYLAPDGPGGKAIIDFMGQVSNKATEVIGKINFKELGDKFLKFLEGLPALIDKMAKIVDAIVRFTGGPVVFRGRADDRSGEVRRREAELGEGRRLGSQSLPSQRRSAAPPIGFGRRSWGRVGFEETGKDAASGLQKGIEAGAPGAAAAAAGMAAGAHAAAKDALDSHSPSLLAMKLGGDYAEGWGIGVEQGLEKQRSRFSTEDFADVAPGAGKGRERWRGEPKRDDGGARQRQPARDRAG